MDLAEIRKEIDQIDVDLITLLEKRMALVRKNSMKIPLCRLFQIF